MDNKQSAIEFLKLVVAGNIEEAYQNYVNMDGKHHNAYYPAGFPALKKGMEENNAQFPNKQLEIKHVIADGNLVIAHSHVVLKKHQTEIAVAHILRFENGKIIEMWDVGQAIPSNLPNKDGIF